MDSTLKKIIAAAAAALVLAIAYYGSFLPLYKSMAFIGVYQNLNQSASLQDFENEFSRVLDIPSPVGQEELVRNMTNIILSSLRGLTGDTRAAEELVRFAEGYYAPIISYGRGMSFGQDVYLMGAINEYMFTLTKNPQYLLDAQRYFQQGLELGPKRPQFLYGMFDIYRMEGNADGARAIGEQVLSQWPSDAMMRQALQQLAQPAAPSSTKPSAKR